MSLGPAKLVPGPAPQPPRFTLVGAAQIPDDASDPGGQDRWLNGVNVWTYPCGPALATGVCDDDVSFVDGDGPGLLDDVQPVTIYLPVKCQVRYDGIYQDLRDLATTAFAAYEYAAIEREFMLGEINPDNPRLASPDADLLNSGTATTAQHALGLLERSIASSRTRGIIHATADVVSDWDAGGALSVDGGKLVTALGTVVVPGYGYTGAKPDGTAAAADHSWAYATGPVLLRRDATIVLPGDQVAAIDRPTNTIRVYVMRNYQVAYDPACLHSAVLIDRAPA